MKKFLLSLCAIAVAGVCMFMTSCKDDDDPIIYNNIKEAVEKVQDQDAVYEYYLNGQKVETLEQLQKLLENQVPGTEVNVTIKEIKDGQEKTSSKNITIPTGGTGKQTVVLDIPTIGQNGDVTQVVIELEVRHNGGGVN